MNQNNIEKLKDILIDTWYDVIDWLADLFESDQKALQTLRTNRHILLWITGIGLLSLMSIRLTSGTPVPELPAATASSETTTAPSIAGPSSPLALNPNAVVWPADVEAAIGIVGQGVVLSSANGQEALPMASLAKLLTALVLVDEYPLAEGESGPSIPLTAADIEIYNNYVAINGSVLPVEGLESMTLHDVLQALLIRSANNLADTAVIWAFGSVEAYVERANAKAAELGLETLQVADATGFSPDSKASAEDLVRLGELTMQNPVLAEIAGTWSTELTGIGPIFNTNNFLDFEGNGVIGVKTGDTDEAGGTYISAARRTVLGEDIIILVSILKGPDHFTAQQIAMPLFDQAVASLEKSQR